MSKILVTGHRGWIGSNFTKLLDFNKLDWTGIDRVEGHDLLENFQTFDQKVKDCDVVVHLAATARIPPSWQQYNHYRNNNISVTDQVARTCADLGKHLIFTSSSSIYGNGAGPLNPYSWTKLAGELSIEMYGRSRSLGYTNLRLFTNYGEDDVSGLVIGKWIKAQHTGNSITVRGTGEQTRDFIHVSDTARALLSVVQQKPYQKTLDIGTGQSQSLIELSKYFTVPVKFEPEIEGYARHTQANLTHTQQHISWKPQVNLVGWLKSQLAK